MVSYSDWHEQSNRQGARTLTFSPAAWLKNFVYSGSERSMREEGGATAPGIKTDTVTGFPVRWSFLQDMLLWPEKQEKMKITPES